MTKLFALILLVVMPICANADDSAFLKGWLLRCLAAEPLTIDARQGYPKFKAAPTVPCTNLIISACMFSADETACLSNMTKFISNEVSESRHSLVAQGKVNTAEGKRQFRLIDDAPNSCPADRRVSEPEMCDFFDAQTDLIRLAEVAALSGTQIWRELELPKMVSDLPARVLRHCLDTVGTEPREERKVWGQLPSVRADGHCIRVSIELCEFAGNDQECISVLHEEVRRQLRSLPPLAAAIPAFVCEDSGDADCAAAAPLNELMGRRATARIQDGDS